jgi:hypothetical protein
MIRIERNPSRGQLAVFGIAWLVFFGFLGGTSWWKTGLLAQAGVLWAIAVVIPAAGLVWPSALRMAFLGMSYATFPIGWGASHLLLALLYYVVLTPIGLFRRFAADDPMGRRFDRSVETYWTPRGTEEGTERYFKQF